MHECNYCHTPMDPRVVGPRWDGSNRLRDDPTIIWVCPHEDDGNRHDTLRTGGGLHEQEEDR